MYSNELVIQSLKDLEQYDEDSVKFTVYIRELLRSYSKLSEVVTYVSHGVFTIQKREEDCTPIMELFQRPDYSDGMVGRLTVVERIECGVTYKNIEELFGTFDKGDEIFNYLFEKLFNFESKSGRDFD